MKSNIQKRLDLNLSNYPINLPKSLERVKILLDKVGSPQNYLNNIIHIAGTNGKGSVLAYIKSCLITKGFKVNALISPHLKDVNERIVINNNLVKDNLFIENFSYLNSLSKNEKISFFEIITACAYNIFHKHPSDWNLIEVGMGGQYDATNIIPKKDLAIITPISLDHEEFLGNDIFDITKEKIGITNKNILTVVGEQEDKVQNLILKDFLIKSENRFIYGVDWTLIRKKNEFFYEDEIGSIKITNPKMIGEHQKKNAALSVASLQMLKRAGKLKISNKEIEAGIKKTYWPGRLEFINKGEYKNLNNLEVWADSCHNPAGSDVISKEMEHMNSNDRKEMILIFSLKKNKSILRFLNNFENVFKKFIYIEFGSDHYNYEEVLEKVNNFELLIKRSSSIEQAIKMIEGKSPSRVLVCGSMQLVGELIKDI
jgi:dihydrofolate synthase/folylpolyglutamate synthase